MRNQRGFTIVELLVVIVVIAILAAITIVAYNGIQNRAYNTTVQSDLANLAKKVSLINAETGAYPLTLDASMGIKLTRSAYADTNNVYYCAETTGFAVLAKSKSGTNFTYSSQSGAGGYAGSFGATPFCTSVGLSFQVYGYNSSTQSWFSWVN
jgi:prepilin-type N-terminal cleavage/methylation domain-containing protein